MTESAEHLVALSFAGIAFPTIEDAEACRKAMVDLLTAAHQERDEANRRADEATAREAAMREALEKMLAHARGTVKWFEAQSLADAALSSSPPQALADLRAKLRRECFAECAEIAESQYGGFEPDNDHGRGYKRACGNITAAIRQLAQEG